MNYVICTNSGMEPENFTKGKIYEIEGGSVLRDDNGTTFETFSVMHPFLPPAKAWVAWTEPLSIDFEVFYGSVRRF